MSGIVRSAILVGFVLLNACGEPREETPPPAEPASGQGGQPQETASESVPAEPIAAEVAGELSTPELLAEFLDRGHGDRYIGREIVVTGKVAKTGRDMDRGPYVDLETERMYYVRCFGGTYGFEAGDEARLRGVVEGRTGGIMIRDCQPGGAVSEQ